MQLEPIVRARTRQIRARLPLRDDAFEAVLRDDLEERLAVGVEVGGYAHGPAAQVEISEAPAPLLERTREERTVVEVQEVEGYERRPESALRCLRPEASGEQVVRGSTARVAHDDLAVEERAFWNGKRREFRDERQQVATAAVDDAHDAVVA